MVLMAVVMVLVEAEALRLCGGQRDAFVWLG